MDILWATDFQDKTAVGIPDGRERSKFGKPKKVVDSMVVCLCLSLPAL